MKIIIIILAVVAVVCAVIEIVSRVVGRREKARFDKMSPDEQRKHQEQMYKAKHFSDAKPQ